MQAIEMMIIFIILILCIVIHYLTLIVRRVRSLEKSAKRQRELLQWIKKK